MYLFEATVDELDLFPSEFGGAFERFELLGSVACRLAEHGIVQIFLCVHPNKHIIKG